MTPDYEGRSDLANAKQLCGECSGAGVVTHTRTVTLPSERLSFPETRNCPLCDGVGEQWDPFLVELVVAAWGRFDPQPERVLDAILAYLGEGAQPPDDVDDDAWRRAGRQDSDWPLGWHFACPADGAP